MTAAVRTFGEDRTLDVLINCAGFESANRTVHPQFWYHGAGEDMMFLYRIMTVVCNLIDEQMFDSSLQLTSLIQGPLITYERFLPNLKRSALGKVVNIACACKKVPWFPFSNQCTEKVEVTDARDAQYRFAHAGLKSLSKLIAHDVRFRGDNIAVLCLDPGDAPFVYDRSNEAAIQALGDCVQDIYLEIEQATLADSETF